jgi:RNA polymerase sigma factor (sigma-70 family)
MILEDNIIKGCLKEDRNSQKELYNRYSGKMMAICYRYANSRMEAEDMLQEGFIKVFDKIKSFKGKGSLEGWVRRVIVNNNINIIRQNKIKFENIDDVEYELIEPITDEVLDKLNEKVLLDLISKMPNGYRSVFNMYVFDGLSHKEIAYKLNTSEVNSRTQYSKSKKYLQKQINKLENGKVNK